MQSFEALWQIAASRKGGAQALEELITQPKSSAELLAIGDDRWLADMTRAVFQAGFNWSVIDNKWNGFETAFEGFDPHRWRLMSDEDIDRLLADTSIVRHGKKILSVRDNATFVCELQREHGSAAAFFAGHPKTDFVGLLDTLKKRANRLGGTTAQYFLRRMGVDALIFTPHVCQALIREGVVDKPPSSKRDMALCQQAFNQWLDEGAGSLNRLSRVLAFTVDV